MDFSLVLPCYNEAEHILVSIEEIIKILDISKFSYEIILIDDKSTDSTKKLIKQIRKKHKNIRAYFHSKNQGRGATVTDGILKSRSDIVGFIDIDLEVSPAYIPQMVEQIKDRETDIVIGKRYYPSDIFSFNSIVRDIFGQAYHFLVRILTGFPVEDTEAGYKFFNKRTILQVLSKTKNKKWFWDTEIILRSHLSGLTIKEIPVLFLRRSDKTSTVKIVADSVDYFKSLTGFIRKINREFTSRVGILYNFPALYGKFMQFYYGASFQRRNKLVAKIIKEESSVVDVCCGDAKLFDFLNNKDIKYLGVDASIHFVRRNISRGIRTALLDVAKEEIPKGDYLILQGSLYQFADPTELIKKLYGSTNKCLIITEQMEGIAASPLIRISPLKKLLSAVVGTNSSTENFRFDEISFKSLLAKYKPRYVMSPKHKEIIAVINK